MRLHIAARWHCAIECAGGRTGAQNGFSHGRACHRISAVADCQDAGHSCVIQSASIQKSSSEKAKSRGRDAARLLSSAALTSPARQANASAKRSRMNGWHKEEAQRKEGALNPSTLDWSSPGNRLEATRTPPDSCSAAALRSLALGRRGAPSSGRRQSDGSTALGASVGE